MRIKKKKRNLSTEDASKFNALFDVNDSLDFSLSIFEAKIISFTILL